MKAITIPADFEVQPIDPKDPNAIDPATCGTCGLTWDDGIPTSWTPAPSGRCPFEYFHPETETEDVFRLYVRTGNAAFADDPAPELARILRAIADRVESGEDLSHYLTVFDVNGNDVGRFALKEEDA